MTNLEFSWEVMMRSRRLRASTSEREMQKNECFSLIQIILAYSLSR